MVRRLMLVLSFVIGLSMVSPAANAEASSIETIFSLSSFDASSFDSSSWSVGSWSWSGFFSWLRAKLGIGTSPSPSQNGAAVPELDPGAAGSALVLLIGGVAYLTSRRRAEEEQA